MISQIQTMMQNIIYDIEVLKYNICDYHIAHILVKASITVTTTPETHVSFKICALFTKCITKIDGTTKNDAEDADLLMLIYFKYC